jgi:hypothetical protein
MSLLAALSKVNPAALAFPLTDLSGNLNCTDTLPTSQSADPNATCPPSQAELNMGLIGCALAMIDLSTFKVVGPGSALVSYNGQPLIPPSPTLALSAKTATPGQVVNVSDAPGATTYWWLSTVTGLQSLLGSGSAAPPVVTVSLKNSNNVKTTDGQRDHGHPGGLQLPGADPAQDLWRIHRASDPWQRDSDRDLHGAVAGRNLLQHCLPHQAAQGQIVDALSPFLPLRTRIPRRRRLTFLSG